MVIDVNETKLDTIEQVREFLQGTADVAFCIPADESTLRTFVAAVIRRLRYFRLAKGELLRPDCLPAWYAIGHRGFRLGSTEDDHVGFQHQ